MAQFTTRVELHNATYEDYKVLHAAMERRGFSRTILGDDGSRYHLPTAEYDLTSERSGEEVRGLAAAAAEETGKKYAVLVTKALSRYWTGLPKA